MNIGEYLKGIKPGEIVLVEHSSLSPYPEVLYEICKDRWDKVILTDFLDSGVHVLRHLKYSGKNIPIDKIKRIKVGGYSKWGRVILDMDPYKDPVVLMINFFKTLVATYKEVDKAIAIVLNHEKLLARYEYDPYLLNEVLAVPTTLIGNPLRTAFVFMNYELTEKRYLALFEEIATRIIRVDDSGIAKVVKSIDLSEEGRELKVIP
ncbi:hypothetical protein A3L04_03885 [Thermococcus chitonophagus]|uniref:Uncharacterized protein n=1 Tax=Thermococcus chitonophagus TaxID=54262 RepID=A0A161KAS8_9EURY|nr:DUF257 family protein [Thermococcus chitonophagus]ASJ16274.1 hypothetical protein A3L04_03885 [Thermococcus chitonophagus]CUX78740.1 hypothetical protein CHITON_1961 [Thermococcus chitonophagus]